MLEIHARACRIKEKGNLIGMGSVVISTEIGDIKIERLKIAKDKTGKTSVYLPQQQYTKNGKIQYVDIIDLPFQVMKEIENQALKQLGL